VSGTYRFRDTWLLAAAPRAVFAAIADLETYPDWWADVRSVSQVDGETAELICRAALPYRLVLRMHRVEQDERAGRLRVKLTGDLEGFLAGLVLGSGEETRLEITQEVVARKPLLRRLDPLARPLFRANHAMMMRRGRRGLRTHLGSSTT
jgi:uncharacterized protein YndB with AHSA1/START domain